MPRKMRELKSVLRKAGFERRRVRGSHERWIHPELPEFPVTLAGKDSNDVKPYVEVLVNDALRRLEDKQSEEE